MRGIYFYIATFIHNGRTEGWDVARGIVRLDWHQFCYDHYAHFFDEKMLRAVYLRLPFTRFSTFVEWREVNVGFGHELLSPHDWEFYLGRIQGCISVTPTADARVQ